MIASAPNVTHLWARLIMEELVRCGVTHCFLAPGSRSTPLAVAAAHHPAMHAVVHFDERGTAFAALGFARATGTPAAWITTSGTAVANGLPAVIEAAMDGVPMLLLTADRPPELRHTGANQTIDQVKLFGGYTRWAVDLPVPSAEIAPEVVLTTIDQAVHRTTGVPAGPVHLNMMFREPLEPEGGSDFGQQYMRFIDDWLAADTPYTRYEHALHCPSEASTDHLSRLLQPYERVLVVAGRMVSRTDGERVLALARHMQWPVLPDAASTLRLARAEPGDVRILAYDHLLDHPCADERLKPDVVLHVGAVPTSKRLLQALDRWRPNPYVHVHPDPRRLDPNHQVTHRLQASIGAFCEQMMHRDLGSAKKDYMDVWREADRVATRRLDVILERTEVLSEPVVARTVSRLLPEGDGLVLASSMPIRDVDMYAGRDGEKPYVVGNRGASGIDGLVATAAGFAHGSGGGVTLLIGDLALLHDLNSLHMIRELPVVIVVVNNDGGGIFSFLPIAGYEDVFEPYFGTPHGLSFESAAAHFLIPYTRAVSREGFEEAYVDACSSGKPKIIEVATDRQENHALHEQLLALVREAL